MSTENIKFCIHVRCKDFEINKYTQYCTSLFIIGIHSLYDGSSITIEQIYYYP